MTNGDKLLSMYRVLDSMLDDKSLPRDFSDDVLAAHDSIERVLLKMLLLPSVSFQFLD